MILDYWGFVSSRLVSSHLLSEYLSADSLNALHAKEEERNIILSLILIKEGEEKVRLRVVNGEVLYAVVQPPPVCVST